MKKIVLDNFAQININSLLKSKTMWRWPLDSKERLQIRFYDIFLKRWILILFWKKIKFIGQPPLFCRKLKNLNKGRPILKWPSSNPKHIFRETKNYCQYFTEIVSKKIGHHWTIHSSMLFLLSLIIRPLCSCNAIASSF